jgi:integrase
MCGNNAGDFSMKNQSMRSRPTWALQKKRNGWFLFWSVPKSIRDLPLFGGKRIYTKTLETSDLREAQRKRDAIIARFEQMAALAEEAPKRQRFNSYLAELDKALASVEGRFDEIQTENGVELVHSEAVHHAYDLENAEIAGNEELADAIRFALHKELHVADKYAVTLKEAVKSFLKAQQCAVTGKPVHASTLSRIKHGTEAILVFLGKGDIPLKNLERRDVTMWVASMVGQKSDSTRLGYVAAMSLVWERCYLRREIDGENPFKNVNFKSQGDRKSYQPFTVNELAMIVNRSSFPIVTLVKFGLVTGCRISELVSLKLSDFEQATGANVVCIRKGKTASATRAIPLPDNLWSELKQCVADKVWVGVRGSTTPSAWSNAFGNAKKDALGERDRANGFHSLRGMTITGYQRAGVSEDITAPIVGHSTQGLTMSYGLYSAGHDYTTQLKAVETMLASDYMQQFLKLFSK